MIWRWHVHIVPGFRAQQFSAIHADDLSRGLRLVADRGERLPPGGEARGKGVYYITDPERPTYADLGRLISAAIGHRHLRVVPVPMPLVWTASALSQSIDWLTRRPRIVNLDKYRESAAGHWICSAEKINTTLAFEPAAPLAARFRQTAEWYRQAGWI